MLGNLTGWHMLIILAVVVLLFGAAKLPALAKAVGQSTKIFKAEMKVDDPAPVAATAPVVQAEAAPVAVITESPKL
jgi:sec-independent protein translocase protein TatA